MQQAVVASDVQRMFGSIAARYDLGNTVLSFGVHHWWRRVLLHMLPPAHDALVLDVCTGTGDLLKPIANRFGRVVGVDFCGPMLEKALAKHAARGESFPLVQGDALALPFQSAAFDIATVAFGVRNFENLERGLAELRRVIRPGGHLLVLEFGQPRNRLFGAAYRFYSKHILPRVGALITGNADAYRYLPRTAEQFPCREAFVERLVACGFNDCRWKSLTGGIAYAYCARAGTG